MFKVVFILALLINDGSCFLQREFERDVDGG